MSKHTIEEIPHLQKILKSNAIEIIPYLYQYEKDGVTPALLYDLSGYMEAKGAMISRNSNNEIPSTFTCTLRTELDWTEAVLQPEVSIKDQISGDTSHWRMGQYWIETPITKLNKPNEYQIQAYDIISMYNSHVVHSYEILKDQDIIISMTQGLLGNTIDWGLVSPRFRIPASSDKAPNDRVWALSEQLTYLNIANDLLDTLGYRNLYSDREGYFSSNFLQRLFVKQPDLKISSEDENSIVSLNTEYLRDTWQVPNTWLGISGNINQDTIPTVGSGIYTIVNQGYSNIKTAINSTSKLIRGRPINKIVTVDAANQFALISLVEYIAEKDVSSIEKIIMRCVPFPAFWHETVAEIYIPVFNVLNKKMVARSWDLPLDGSDMTVNFDVLNELPQ